MHSKFSNIHAALKQLSAIVELHREELYVLNWGIPMNVLVCRVKWFSNCLPRLNTLKHVEH